MDGIVADAGHRRRNVEVLQVLVPGETAAADGLQTFRQTRVFQLLTIVEGFVSDRCHTIGDIDGLQGVATVESLFANAGKRCRQLYLAQAVALCEHSFWNGGHARLGEGDAAQLLVV